MTPRPELLPVNVAGIPESIRSLPRWCVWRLVRDGKRWTKQPYQTDGVLADSTDPRTWCGFESALAAYSNGGSFDGIGFFLGKAGPEHYSGVDWDHCRDPQTGEIEDSVLEEICALDTYAEVSPSGTGIKALALGALPPGRRRKGKHEMYDADRFFTLTGCVLPDVADEVRDRSAELAALHARIFPPKPNGKANGKRPRPASTLDLDDEVLIERARAATNGRKFSALWSGDTSGYDSASEADQALANLLAFWTGADPERMDRLFRRSGLFREKWDNGRGSQTYGEKTIETAIISCRETYRGPAPPAVEVVDEPETEPETEPTTTYTFEPAVPRDHFVSRWIAYAASRTDAASEYHEAAALVLLASATPTVRARLAPYPNGLPTNLYVLIVGDSTTSRKSTSKDLARDVQARALPGSLSADHFSPRPIHRLATELAVRRRGSKDSE